MTTYRIIDTIPSMNHIWFYTPQIRKYFIYVNLINNDVSKYDAMTTIRDHMNAKAGDDFAFANEAVKSKPKSKIWSFITWHVFKYQTVEIWKIKSMRK